MRACARLAYTSRFSGFSGAGPASLCGEATLGIRIGHRVAAVATSFLLAAGTLAAAEAKYDAAAIQLNNRGVAQMGQQFTDKAAASFADAFKKDPRLAQAAVNEGIALMTLQKLDDAKKSLRAALALDPHNAQAWYNLGLAQHADNETEAALASFQQAVKSDPRDTDSRYFEGVCFGELKQFDQEIDVLKQALAITPLHASSEFAMARALQRTGHTPEAKEHFKTFQHLTSTKISAAIGLAYGEQGHYSTVTPVEEPQTVEQAMIPVRRRRLRRRRAERPGRGAGRQGAAVSQSGQRQVSGRDGGGWSHAAQSPHGHHVCGLRPRRRSGFAADRRAAEAGRPAQRAVAQQRQQDLHRMDRADRPWRQRQDAAAILTDFNNDRAVDLAVTGDGPAPLIYVNPREGKYPTQPLYEGVKAAAHRGHCRARLQQRRLDGHCRHACGRAGAYAVAQCRGTRIILAGALSAWNLPLHGALRGWGVTPIDIDNDGWIDLAAIVETKAGPQVRVFRNRGDGSFEDVSHALGLDK
jgi:tetratricopeptide (TPR) repeat protein